MIYDICSLQYYHGKPEVFLFTSVKELSNPAHNLDRRLQLTLITNIVSFTIDLAISYCYH